MANIYRNCCIHNVDIAYMGNDIKQAAITSEFLCTHKVSIWFPIVYSFTLVFQASIIGS